MQRSQIVGLRMWSKAFNQNLRDYMSSLHGKLRRGLVSTNVIVVIAMMIAGCAQVTNPAPTQTSTATLAVTPDARTPAPNTVEVRLAVAPDSSEASFAVRNVRGEVIFQTYWPLVREYVLYLPPGDYTWSANLPVPTPPLGCFIVEQSTGFWKDGRFTAVKERIEIEVRFVYVVSFCTPTPGTP